MSGGGFIRMVRQEMGLTQREFGALFGEGRWYISQMERDQRPNHEVRDLSAAIGTHLALRSRG